MADAIISSVVERVASITAQQIRYQVNLVRDVEKEVLDLHRKLKTIRNVLDDAEKRGVNDQSIQKWLKNLEVTAYEMDDILDEWNYALLKHNAKKKVCCSFILSSSSCFNTVVVRHHTAKKIQNVKATLDHILKDKDEFRFVMSPPATDSVPKLSRAQSTSSIEFGKVHGQDIDINRNDIVRKLILNGDSQILCIVGMGGIGKTTLAQLVYNDTRVKDCFDLRIWICVSDPFDVAVIARAIVEIVGTQIIPSNTVQLELILRKLRDSITGKKFLLVLDDVWTDDYNKWEPLKINLNNGAHDNKILVTTRKDSVAKMMMRGDVDVELHRPQQLTDEECWTVLRRVSLSGRSDEECGKFEEVGKKIAMMCNGLPLAANVLGSFLQFMYSLEEWENVLKSEVWQMKQAELELFPHLLLSYNELSPALKRCFSYCAVYPKDSRIYVERLIEEWMAQGYLGYDTGDASLELKGREYFNNLAMRSLFQDMPKSYSGEQMAWCKMHDIVHDFAQFLRKNNERDGPAEMTKTSCQACDPTIVSLVQEYRSLIWGEEYICDCITNIRVLKFKYTVDNPPLGLEKLIHLRWLKLSGTTLSEEDLKVICRFYFLQTLFLARCSVEEIPKEIGNLVHLRRLDLSGNKELRELPESMCSLVELQTLFLASCSLREIPEEIGNLVELRHLDLSHNEELRELPESMCSLVELQTLFLASCSLREIPEEIGNLVELRDLDLSNNEELKELPESICSLVELQFLNIERCIGLKGFPEGIHRLQSLKHLLFKVTPLVERYCFPQGIGQLSGLRTLSDFHVGRGRNKLGLLKNLNRLTGSLTLGIHFSRSTDLVELVEDAREAELRNKKNIQTLHIEFKDEEQWSLSSSSTWMDVIEALEPSHQLEIVVIQGYKGLRLPHWISSPLKLIKRIYLDDMSEVSSLPPMGKLPLLEDLHMDYLKELKLGREFLGLEYCSSNDAFVVAFPKLKSLTFSLCRDWWEWEDITKEEEETAAVTIMPCLTELRIKSCGGLKKLPQRLMHKASSLQILNITKSLGLQKSYGDKNGYLWRSISQTNPKLKLIY